MLLCATSVIEVNLCYVTLDFGRSPSLFAALVTWPVKPERRIASSLIISSENKMTNSKYTEQRNT
jgi:hypothetical protein